MAERKAPLNPFATSGNPAVTNPFGNLDEQEREWLSTAPSRAEVYAFLTAMTVQLGRLSEIVDKIADDPKDTAAARDDLRRRVIEMKERLSLIPGMRR